MRIRFTLGDARQIGDRYSCYLLGVLVAEVDEHLKSLWRMAAARDRSNMHVYSLHASVASREIASRYGSGGGHPAQEVAGLAHRIHEIVAAIYEEHRAMRGELSDAEIDAIRKDMQKAGRMIEQLAAAATDSCGA